jgi:hypothetical protein
MFFLYIYFFGLHLFQPGEPEYCSRKCWLLSFVQSSRLWPFRFKNEIGFAGGLCFRADRPLIAIDGEDAMG